MISSALAAKTAHLKWLKQLRAERQMAVSASVPVVPCDCAAWLKAKVRQQQGVSKPRLPVPPVTPLVLVAPAAPKNMRHSDYNRQFEHGEARWYHIPAAALQQYNEAQLQAVRYLALGIILAGMGERQARYLYAVRSVQSMPRHMLTVEQAGSLKASDEPYWLFALAESVALEHPIVDFERPFMAKIAVAEQLLHTHSFAALADVKEDLYV